MKKILQLAFVLSGIIVLSGCKIDKGESITVVGSSAMQPLAEAAGNEFSSENLGKFVNVQGGGSGTGLSQVQAGAVDIGNSDVFAEEKSGIDASKLVGFKVAVVGITPIINKEVGIDNISMKDLASVFAGEITNWKELGGKNLPIVMINRATGSGTRSTFEKWVMKGKETKKAQEQDSTGMVRQIVSTTPGAISYLAFSYVTDDVQALSIDGVEPIDDNVITNKWPIWSYEHMYTKGKPTGIAKDYIDFVLSDGMQNEMLPQLGYIPITMMEVERNADGEIIE